MGAFSNMDYELQNSEAAVSDAFTEDGAMDMPQTAPVEPVTASSPTAAPTPAAAASEPATAPNTQSEDEARRAHEAAEAKRKAEWDAKQAEIPKPAAADHEPVVTALSEQAALERLDAMGPAELLKAAAKRVSADTEKLTRRNMKESVAEFIQTKCIDDLGFARLTMHPRKSMIHCFQYISRKAWDYVQDELKANGVQPGPGQQAYGCDIPDDLCYQWAEDYFRDPDAKEDQGDEEEFVPQPYRGKTASKSVSKKKKEEKKKEPEKKDPPKKTEADDGQISLGDLSSFGEAA